MSEPKYREWILETIDSLRSRKARPDLERICRMVRRRHGSDPERTRTELEKLIQQQTVLKVSYKGSISYRNAAKVQRKSRKKIEFAPACSTSAEESRERTNHNILNNGDSAHSYTDQEEDSEPSLDQQPQTPTSTTENTNRQSSSPRSGIVCLSCGATTGCAVGSGCQRENASASKDPGLGQHLRAGCLSPSHDHGINARDFDTDTKIPPNANRKERGLCGAKVGSGEAADMKNETCPVDVRATAHDATSIEKQKSPVALKPPVRKSDLGDRLVSSVRSLSERNLRAQLKSKGVGVSPVDWTVSDVANYFAAVGFPEQAVAFKAQEIDGRSLLLMQRNDVLTGLSIRLGPAVKIYERHVKALQKTHFEDDDC
ncbi:unnamed protein product [Lota lota]